MVYNTGCIIANGCNGSWGGLWFALGLVGATLLVAFVLWLLWKLATFSE